MIITSYEGGGEQGDWRKEAGEGICGVLLVTLAGKALHGPGNKSKIKFKKNRFGLFEFLQ